MFDNPEYDIENFDSDDEDFYSYEEVDEANYQSIYKYCVKASLVDAYPNLIKLFGASLILNCLSGLRIPDVLFHFASATFGLCMLYVYFHYQFVHTFGVAIASFFVLKTMSYVTESKRGFLTAVPLFVFLVACEFYTDPEQWQKIRGPLMVLTMKVVSLAFDLDNGVINELGFMEYLGYSLCVGTCIFGPWVSFKEYKSCRTSKWDLTWLWKVVNSFVLSVVFFTLNICWIEWFIPDSSGTWWVVYRDALLFRVGHYFVSYVSEVSATLAGTSVTVTKPSKIELPRSLVQVVVFWNLPMHRWLKTYVFKTGLKVGVGTGVAATYIVSSLLHGFNARLAGVLLSLGLFTYVEHSLRSTLSYKFDACLGSRPCANPCPNHSHTSSNLLVHTLNLFLSAMSLFHLAYLGSCFDLAFSPPPNIQIAFAQWFNLNFVSHILILITYFIYLILR